MSERVNHYFRRTPGSGSRTKPGRLSHVTHFDEAQFAEMRAFAVRHKISMGEAVRTLCEWGLESEKLAERRGR